MLIKPNFVTSKNFEEHLRGEKLACSSTHGSVLRPILDYALRAAGPRGKVTIVDTPVEGCNLEEVVDGLGVRALLEWYAARGQRIDFIDLRHFRVVPHMALDDVRRCGRSFNLGLLVRERLPGDPLGYTVVDLGERSFFDEVARRGAALLLPSLAQAHAGAASRARPAGVFDPAHGARRRRGHQHSQAEDAQEVGRDAGAQVVHRAHQREVLAAALHRRHADRRRRRVSLSRRRCAVRIENQLQRFPLPFDHSLIARAPKLADGRSQNGFLHGFIMEGSWEGNDTIWRTVLDLNQILFYADRDGPHARSSAAALPGDRRRHHRRRGRRAAGVDAAPRGPARRRTRSGAGRRRLRARDGLRASADPDGARARSPSGARRCLPSSDLDALRLSSTGRAPTGAFVPPKTWPSLVPA